MPEIHWTQTPEGRARIAKQSKVMHAKKRAAKKANPDIPYNKQKVGGTSKWPLRAQHTNAGRAAKAAGRAHAKTLPRTDAEKHLHWTQTAAGKKKMSDAQLKANARRRAAGLSTPQGKPYKKKAGFGVGEYRHTPESRAAISRGLKARKEADAAGLTMMPTTNGHAHEVGQLGFLLTGQKLTKGHWRQFGMMGLELYRQRLVNELQAVDMALKR